MSKYSLAIGIDPGSSKGCIVGIFHKDGRPILMNECRLSKSSDLDIVKFLESITEEIKQLNGEEYVPQDVYASFEKVSAMPGQGVSSTFKFGDGNGFIRGALVSQKVPYEHVTPQSWQKLFSIKEKGDKLEKSEHKRRLKAKAEQYFPETKMTLENADAYLIAYYAMQKQIRAW